MLLQPHLLQKAPKMLRSREILIKSTDALILRDEEKEKEKIYRNSNSVLRSNFTFNTNKVTLSVTVLEDYWINISESWGLSDIPGSREMRIYPDGTYVKLEKIIKCEKYPNGYQMIHEGSLEQSVLDELIEYCEKHITENYTGFICDYGCSIELRKTDTTTKVIDDTDKFRGIAEIVSLRESPDFDKLFLTY